jgi:hypothetical protein
MGNVHCVEGNGKIQPSWRVVGWSAGGVDGMRYRVRKEMGKGVVQLLVLKSVGPIFVGSCYEQRHLESLYSCIVEQHASG